jgi:hypothetical protein
MTDFLFDLSLSHWFGVWCMELGDAKQFTFDGSYICSNHLIMSLI